MSKTILSPNGKSKVVTVRHTESIDIPNIIKLIDDNTEKYFGKLNIFNFIEKSVFSICLIDDTDCIIGHATFFDFPNIDGVYSASWENWVADIPESNYTPINTLFLGLFVAKEEYKRSCIREILHTMFIAVPDVHYCFLILPVDVSLDSSFVNMFSNIATLQQSVGEKYFNMFICQRHMFEPILYIRDARVEDTDELTPLFDSLNNTLQGVYGNYYLAELIESQTDDMHCIVAEVNDYAVGLMSINSNVDVDYLNNSYDLDIFDCLEHSKQGQHTNTHKLNEIEVSTLPVKSEANSWRPPVRNKSQTSFTQTESSPLETRSQPALSEEVDDTPHNRSNDASLTGTAETNTEDKLSSATIGTTKDEKLSSRANAFYIQLFAINEKYQTRAEDFLMKAFELFPNHDMCIISIPHLVPEFPLLRLFVRASPKRGCFPPQELYVFHRSGLIKDVKVRKACTSDFENIWFLTKNIRQQENILNDLKKYNDFRRDKNGPEIMAFVASITNLIIGVAILRNEEDIEYIRAHYNIEDYIFYNHHEQNEHAHLNHFVVNPAFKYLSKMFMKEILRQSYKNCLYYPLYNSFTKHEVIKTHSLITALSDMVPVGYRRQIVYPPNLGINAPSDKILKKIPAFALTHMNRKLTLEPKKTINARIIVVGASTVGLSFLETLLFCPHLNFNNVTLISPYGLPGEREPNPRLDNMSASNSFYTLDDLARKSLKTWVNVIKSKMTQIVREQKQLVTSHGHTIPYDYLFLCCGMKYFPVTWDITNPMASQLPFFFVINNLVDAEYVLSWLITAINKLKSNAKKIWKARSQGLGKIGNLLVFGNTLDAYCFIRTLLEIGIPGSSIYLLIPSETKETDVLGGVTEELIFTELNKQNVHIHIDCIYVKWTTTNDALTKFAFFHDKTKSFRIEFTALFCYGTKKIDYNAFKAMNDACLIVDDKLVIDNEFLTTDPNIWAAGTFTKYKRILYSDSWIHSKFCSKEIGRTLANKLLKLLNPALEDKTEDTPENCNLVSTYRDPKISTAILPGGYHYLSVTKPAITCEVNSPKEAVGSLLKTGSPSDPCGYFEVYINRYKLVESILCIKKEPFPASNLIQLYGVHEGILNNLLQRFDEGLITDLFKYFMEPYCLPVYHDRFIDICSEIRHVILNEKAVIDIESELKQLLTGSDGLDEMIPKQDIKALIDKYNQTAAPRQLVEHHILAYLYYNYYHLPMFAKPGAI